MTPPGSLSEERWLPVPGYEELYMVSDQGRVYALPRSRQCGHPGSKPQHRPGFYMKPNPVGNPRTHLQLRLAKSGRPWHVKVHQLVLLAFVGPCPEGLEVLHGDDDASNNCLENLRYGTRSENVKDRVRNGIHHQTRKTHCPQGHEYTAENTYVHRPGKRSCKECSRQRSRDGQRNARIRQERTAS